MPGVGLFLLTGQDNSGSRLVNGNSQVGFSLLVVPGASDQNKTVGLRKVDLEESPRAQNCDDRPFQDFAQPGYVHNIPRPNDCGPRWILPFLAAGKVASGAREALQTAVQDKLATL
jgi:hypothetical protein